MKLSPKDWIKVVSVAAIVLAGRFSVAVPPGIKVLFKGMPLKFSRAGQPYRSQATVMVPLAETANLVGATFSWSSDASHALKLSYGKNGVIYEPGHHGYKLNGKRQNMRSSSEIRQQRYFVPVRLFTDITSGKVHAEIF